MSDVVTFALGGEIMAIPADCLREILEPVPVTRVPRAGAFVSGLVNVRGAVVPLADLRVPFGMPDTPPTEDTRMLVLDTRRDGEPVTVAVIADRVIEVSELASDCIETLPPVGTGWPPGFVKGIANRQGDFVLLPDLEKIFSQRVIADPLGHIDEGM